MPIYEYVCNGCGHEFEEWQKITDAPVHKCPSCGKRKAERLVSLSTFHLKGGGWYVTDYGGKKQDSNSSKGSEEGKASVKTDKPEKAVTSEKPEKKSPEKKGKES